MNNFCVLKNRKNNFGEKRKIYSGDDSMGYSYGMRRINDILDDADSYDNRGRLTKSTQDEIYAIRTRINISRDKFIKRIYNFERRIMDQWDAVRPR